jgi:signal transduction histidine kinase/DNA-binding response OmpR family regulator/streptogramin lyase
MKNFLNKLIILLFLLEVMSQGIFAYNLQQFSSKNELSNSAILSICQDKNGLLWIGTCDGLNTFDGTRFRLYKTTGTKKNLSGNLINNVMEAEDNVLWVLTNYGLDRLNTRNQTLQSFKEFKDVNKIAKSRDNDIYTINDNGYIYYFPKSGKSFSKLNVKKVNAENVLLMVVDSSNILWIFSTNGDNRSYSIEKRNNTVALKQRNYFRHQKNLLFAAFEDDLLYFVDSEYGLYEYSFRNKKAYYITDLSNEIRHRGKVSSIIKQRDDYYIGFKNDGLIQLKYMPDKKVKYSLHSINIHSGIFCLVKDKFQDIIWIGTDGQGIYMYYNDSYSIKNTILDDSPYQVNNPVRALYIDDQRSLWVGTKGGGILRMFNYNPRMDVKPSMERLQTNNNAADNTVYCFARSRWNRFWIGTENGIDYYSYSEKKIKNFPIFAGGKRIRFVHSICEFNDTTLWIATVGEGIVSVSLKNSNNNPIVKSAHRILFDKGKWGANYFFVSYKENNSTIWFGNRGYGAFCMDTKTMRMKSYRFNQAVENQNVNDIFAIFKNKEGYWFGTSYGLARLFNGHYHVYSEAEDFPNRAIHGILEDRRGNVWFSTNQGLFRFNMYAKTVQKYYQQSNLEVSEFSDGAYFRDELTGTLFFGGINGFVTIIDNNIMPKQYMPKLQFTQLSIFGKGYNIYDYLYNKKGHEILRLNDKQNFFSLSFVAIDFINGNNYTYSYKIDGLSDKWVENGHSTTATFSNLFPGKYTLMVKYRNNITGKESAPRLLSIYIMPPWYMTHIAYFFYFLLFIALGILFVYMVIKRYRWRRNTMIEKMNRRQRDELYESKLRFFTNITHEFCTPLTLIYGPCEKILSYAKTDGYIHKYAMMIRQNAQRLNALILELIEFRKLETGHQILNIQRIPVTEQTRNIAESFSELAERHKVNYQIKIEDDIYWNSDSNCLNMIVNNLISNAFKYTPISGKITVEQFIENQQLYIRVANTGKGILKENLTKIFDRYKILDNFEVQNTDGISPRNGLGLAICHSMVNLLKGNINVTSEPNIITTFEVNLPMLDITDNSMQDINPSKINLSMDNKPIELKNTAIEFNPSRQTIMIIDDDPSMLWFITEIFIDKYNVMSFNDAEKAIEKLKINQPDLIISDIMMPGMDGMSFTKKIKSDKQLGHTPLILLSALNNVDEQVKGIDSGAEAYITKPFNVGYLEKVVERLIQREKDLKEYYSSVFSSFELDDGHFVHKEDKDFFEKMMQAINKNIQNPELSIDLLSSSLGYSTRQFYRRLKNVTEKSPADIIKEYKLTVAERLLVTTHLSVEEIMQKSGFINRGTFYKSFSLKYGIPPRQYREHKTEDIKEPSNIET